MLFLFANKFFANERHNSKLTGGVSFFHDRPSKWTGDILAKKGKALKLADLVMGAFMKRVKMGPNGGCWIWIGSKSNLGYGKFNANGITYGAHRVSYVLFKGPIAVDLLVLHKCDNPPCVNPDHLRLGTYKQNTRDMIRKGRYKNGAYKLHAENGGNAKLTNRQALEIFKSNLNNVELAAIYDVTPPTIRAIKIKKSFKVIHE